MVSTVDTSKSGEYTVTYSSSDTSGNKSEDVVRKVTVVDTTAPVINLVGLAEVSVTEGSTYNELGATATDIVDGDLSANITLGGDTIDTSAEGEYSVTYNVTDAAGNKAIEVVRKVTVTNSGDTTAPVIVLLGDPEITLEAGDTYTDSGATDI